MSSSDLVEKSVTEKLIRNFYDGSVMFSLQPEEVDLFTWDEQMKFLNATIYNKTVSKYPVSAEFCRLYFKKLIDLLEFKQEVHEDFYTALCSILKDSTVQDFCYKHYIVGSSLENMITIKETKNMVVNGTTGMRTWQAALMLADFAICNKDLFQGRLLLELGSGIGFTGIAIAKYCDINSIMLTDCHVEVLQTIRENIKINFPSIRSEENLGAEYFKDGNKHLGIMMLDWNHIEDIPKEAVPDVLIGADIIYDPLILKPLCDVIKTFFHRNQNLEVYIANVIRNDDTCKLFLEILKSLDLSFENVPQETYSLIKWDCSIQRCLLKITLRSNHL